MTLEASVSDMQRSPMTDFVYLSKFWSISLPCKFSSLIGPRKAIDFQLVQIFSCKWASSLQVCICAKLLQSCPTLCNPMGCSSPGFSVHGILQARMLECVVMPSARASSQPRDQTYIFYISCIGKQVLYQEHYLESPSSLHIKVETGNCLIAL